MFNLYLNQNIGLEILYLPKTILPHSLKTWMQKGQK
jgi:hypothetical protein